MIKPQEKSLLFKKIPKTDKILERLPKDIPHTLKVSVCRQVLDNLRSQISSGTLTDPEALELDRVVEKVSQVLEKRLRPSLRPLINATGVVVHTNLGRSLLPEDVFQQIFQVAVNYSNLEYDLEAGKRGSRYSHVEELLCELTGAESALVVNNNAAAVLLTLETLARGKEVIVSRGELVEIGGSFRIPDVMARSGAILREVGATNRTHLRDYENAINENTALLMKVHQSNFAVVGFTSKVSMSDLKELGKRHGIPVIEDLGSGNLVDLTPYGFMHEPTVQESLKAGADLVSFSGDKMLGGPQAGIIVGKAELVDKIKKNPMNRAVRIDKLTLAGLEAILAIYRRPEEALRRIPTLRMLSMPYEETKKRAERLARRLRKMKLGGVKIGYRDTISRVGGGAMPLQELKSRAVVISFEGASSGPDAARVERRLRAGDPPVIARIEDEEIMFDLRTVQDREFPVLAQCIKKAIEGVG
ncbi:MAG: L-seryl-tRNA(Sec) selenium transferase [Thermodesulfobacteria bacterium]|nr:L-seryl-tRNA(Sec) selenium transferase [Thermodesulfobacteriota bacterium]